MNYFDEPLPGWELADGRLAARSEVLGLELRLAGRRLRFYDPQTGEDLRNLVEVEDGRREAEACVEQEAAARQAAETRVQQEAAARRREAAVRQAAEARLAELEALLRGRSD